MEIVVTGAAGYIGSHVCSELLSQGYKVLAIDDLSTGKAEFLDPRVKFHKGKVQDFSFLVEVLSTLKRPGESGVIHCAGLKFAGESVKFPLHYYDNNTYAVQILLSAMQSLEIPSLVFSSSCSVYGNIESSEPASEDFPLIPVSPYGRSKLFAEKIIQDEVSTNKLKAVALRYFNVAGNAEGVGHDDSQFNLMPNLYRSIVNKAEFTVFGGDYKTKDGSCVRDYVDVSILAKAHITALIKLMSGSALEFAYNLGSGEGASVYQIIQAAKQEISQDLGFTTVSAREGDPAQILADTSRAKRDLGWNHPVSIRQMVLSGWKAWNSSLI
jgi:UDP-glucose 4-epimerase